MADLFNAVYDLQKGKKPEENLPVYAKGLAALYKKVSYIRFTMNYYTFSDSYEEMDKEVLAVVDSEVKALQSLVKKCLIDEKIDLEAREKALKLRNSIIRKMETLTGYIDVLQIYEYIFNRIEFRFKPDAFRKEYYEGMFEKDILRFVTSDKDNAGINLRITQVVGQIPMRLSKNKFYDIIKDSLSLYKGGEQKSLDDFCYMIKTTGTVIKPDSSIKDFKKLDKYIKEFEKMDFVDVEEKEFRLAKKHLEKVTELVTLYSDNLVYVTDILNDLITIILSKDSLTDHGEKKKLMEIIDFSYDMLENGKPVIGNIEENFVGFEGVQEKVAAMIVNPESALEEIMSVNHEAIDEFLMRDTMNDLFKMSRLQSASTFAELEVSNSESEPVSEDDVRAKLEEMIVEFNDIFEKCQVQYKRAVMASVLSVLPVFFNNLGELEAYVHVALSQCNDNAERQGCMEIIRTMIDMENEYGLN